MVDLIQQYNNFKENEKSNWVKRGTWKGLYGNDFHPQISIAIFNGETKAFETIDKSIRNVRDYWKAINSLSLKYIDWVKQKDDIFSVAEYADMVSFFKGFMGEFFAYSLLNEVRKMIVKDGNGKGRQYDFKYVAPLMDSVIKDFGVDLTCILTDADGKSKNCVIQSKFWNEYSDEFIGVKIVQGVYAQGVRDRLIEPYEDKNVVVFWLGNDNHISLNLKRYESLYSSVVFVDMKALDLSINGRNDLFWTEFFSSINTILNHTLA